MKWLFVFLFLFASGAACAQQQVVPGYMKYSGCPASGPTPCFVQNGPSGGTSPTSPSYVTQAPTSALTTFSNQTNSIGTSGTDAITLGGAAITTASFATVDLWNNSSTCDVLINRSGATVTATAWDTRLTLGNSPLRLGNAIDYPVPPSGNITAMAVNAGTTVACTGGGFALQAGAH